MPRRLRVLISAYYCSPYRGGEAAVGWRYATGLAQDHDVTVICGDLAADGPIGRDIERYKREQGLPPGLSIHHIQAEGLTRKIHDLHALPGMWFFYYEAYRRWQLEVLALARRLHAEQAFDLVHHLTIIGFREPGYLREMGIPFVWGPINGAALMPWHYIGGFGGGGAYRHLTRNFLNLIQSRLPGRSRRAARAAAKIWCVTREDLEMVEDLWGCAGELMIETGASPVDSPSIRCLHTGEPLRLVWCGLIEDRKALHLLLEALASLPAGLAWELEVIGDGPRRERCKAMAASLGIAASVHWAGSVGHAEAQELMARGHVLVHSSLKEGTPHVVLEALSQALPVICHDACGMGVAVTEECGIKVPMLDPDTSIRGFRDAIIRIATEQGLLEQLSGGAISRAREQSWQSKIAVVSAAYRQIAASPEFI
ncbi:glycosyltransferase [Luteolibacter sp. GHJ8]|uniref:Glycosyltransferase n=1 Tax=Luteolibacter rhizosphaerae TaxID=2989719 RepID=A0ABT3FYK4_9BACT|nr:glycosyltransferase [Luteolibacter rhizosphaerae]MCW1912688.1 glycosyltransferase [Luteolibacter rhizosphaerae]